MSAGRVDSHTHLWDLARRVQGWIDPAWGCGERYRLPDLTAALDSAGFGSAVLVQSTQGLAETQEFLALAHHSGQVAAVVGWIDLTGDIGAQLDRIGTCEHRRPLVGIRHPAEHEQDPAWLAGEPVTRAVDELGRRGLAYDLLVRPRNFAAVCALARRAPNTRLVLDHCGKPPMDRMLAEWSAGIGALAKHDNIACKFSGLVTEVRDRPWTLDDLHPIFDTVMEAFGPHRTMFGGDWPLCLTAGRYEDVVAAAVELADELTPAERSGVFGGTARDWYRIPL